jgi:thiol-disulfide isomerase/thioredoxin
MKCLLVLVILALFLVLLRFTQYGSNEYYENEGFQSATSVVICKAEWCSHCKQAAPEFQKLVDASPIKLQNGSIANVTMLDADADKDKLAAYKVRGYPTILVNNGADPIEYPGERTYNGVIEYLNSM